MKVLCRHGECANVQYPRVQLVQVDAFYGVDFENVFQQVETFVRDGQYLAQVEWVGEKELERVVGWGSLSPGVATADEVDKDDAE